MQSVKNSKTYLIEIKNNSANNSKDKKQIINRESSEQRQFVSTQEAMGSSKIVFSGSSQDPNTKRTITIQNKRNLMKHAMKS